VTLERAVFGIAGMLCEAHEESQERVLARLAGKLKGQGFDTHSLKARRTA
jgi:hypothetical protein